MSSDLSSQNISFIGGGNMAAAIISGLLATPAFASPSGKARIYVSEPWDVNRAKMAALGVRTTTSNADAAREATIVILAVKPQVAKPVCEELASSWSTSTSTTTTSTSTSEEATATATKTAGLPLVVSIAAGIPVESLRTWCTTTSGAAPAVVRVMPNTPALLGEGASGLYAGPGVSGAQRGQVTALLGSVSKATEWVDREELIDVVTGLSGSGPAYFFAMVEHLIAAATKLGLPADAATRLAAQTCLGAGRMLTDTDPSDSDNPNSSGVDPGQLRRNVTSPHGTTEAALRSFEASGFEAVVERAVRAAAERGEELGRTLGGSTTS